MTRVISVSDVLDLRSFLFLFEGLELCQNYLIPCWRRWSGGEIDSEVIT